VLRRNCSCVLTTKLTELLSYRGEPQTEFPEILTNILANRTPAVELQFVDPPMWCQHIPPSLAKLTINASFFVLYPSALPVAFDFLRQATNLKSIEQSVFEHKIELEDHTFPPYHQLDIINHPWNEYTPTDLKVWDFSKLTRLFIEGQKDHLQGLVELPPAETFPNLKEIRVVLSKEAVPRDMLMSYDFCTQQSSFIAGFSSLTSIELEHFDFESLIPAIENTGDKLLHLSLYEAGQWPKRYTRVIAHEEGIATIRSSCKNLERLILMGTEATVCWIHSAPANDSNHW
jgi:hypothetical protein